MPSSVTTTSAGSPSSAVPLPPRRRHVLAAGLLVGGALATGAVFAAVPASAYPAGVGCTLTTSTSVGAPGDGISVTGNGYQPGGSVDLTWTAGGSTSVTVAADGTFTTELTVPSGSAPFTLQSSGGCDGARGSVALTGATSSSGSSSSGGSGLLASTGFAAGAVALSGLALTGAGIVVVATSRRRHSSS